MNSSVDWDASVLATVRVASGCPSAGVILAFAHSSQGRQPFSVNRARVHLASMIVEPHSCTPGPKLLLWPSPLPERATCRIVGAYLEERRYTAEDNSRLGAQSDWVERREVADNRDLEREVWVRLDEDSDAFAVADSEAM